MFWKGEKWNTLFGFQHLQDHPGPESLRVEINKSGRLLLDEHAVSV